MKTKKPEIVAYMRPAYGEVISQEEYARWEHEATRNPGTPYGEWRKNETIEYSEPLIRLSDYEALQSAEQPQLPLPDFITDPDDSDEGASLWDHGFKQGWNSCLEAVAEDMQHTE